MSIKFVVLSLVVLAFIQIISLILRIVCDKKFVFVDIFAGLIIIYFSLYSALIVIKGALIQ